MEDPICLIGFNKYTSTWRHKLEAIFQSHVSHCQSAEVALLLSAGTFWAPEKEGTHRPPSTRGIIGALDGFFM